jgi:hypothetical protein
MFPADTYTLKFSEGDIEEQCFTYGRNTSICFVSTAVNASRNLTHNFYSVEISELVFDVHCDKPLVKLPDGQTSDRTCVFG